MGVRAGKGSSVEEAARRLGDVKPTTLASQIRTKVLTPDWSIWKYEVPEPAHTLNAADAVRRGLSPEHDLTHIVPDGYRLKGASTLYGADGEAKLQWVKSQADEQRQQEIFRQAVAAMVDYLPRYDPVPAPSTVADTLMACYPVGDHHIGMLAWGEEAGDNYDISIAERLLSGAMTHLVKAVPPCGRAAIVILGDWTHYDSFVAVTPTNKNPLDADGRFPKMVRASIRCLRRMVAAALEHHAEVLLIVEVGNHDLASSIFLMESMAALYENEPRVKVDSSPRHFHYFEFGKCLVGTHHGHGVKMDQLPLIMATDLPDVWGRTEYRYWWTGHIHTDKAKRFDTQDFAGCRVESFRVLPPTDAWAENKGYRPQRDMKSIVLHRDYGEVARHIVNPAMLEAAHDQTPKI